MPCGSAAITCTSRSTTCSRVHLEQPRAQHAAALPLPGRSPRWVVRRSTTRWQIFLLGLPQQEGKQIQIFNPLTYRQSEFALFAQNTWQVTPSLTLNYGVRYHYYPLEISDHYGLLRYDPTVQTTVTDTAGTHLAGSTIVGGKGGQPNSAGVNNHHGLLVPRFGVFYRINDKTVVRSGFGITVDPEQLRTLLSAYPQNIGLTQIATGHAAAAQLNAASATYLGSPSLNLIVGLPAVPLATVQSQFASGEVAVPANIQTYTVPQDFGAATSRASTRRYSESSRAR